MLTVRLQCEGVLSAFQTNRVVSLIHEGCEEFDLLIRNYPGGPHPAVFDVGSDIAPSRKINLVTARQTETKGRPKALIKLDQGRNEFGDGTGDAAYAEGARFICLYENDTAFVLDAGAKLFGWPVPA